MLTRQHNCINSQFWSIMAKGQQACFLWLWLAGQARIASKKTQAAQKEELLRIGHKERQITGSSFNVYLQNAGNRGHKMSSWPTPSLHLLCIFQLPWPMPPILSPAACFLVPQNNQGTTGRQDYINHRSNSLTVIMGGFGKTEILREISVSPHFPKKSKIFKNLFLVIFFAPAKKMTHFWKKKRFFWKFWIFSENVDWHRTSSRISWCLKGKPKQAYPLFNSRSFEQIWT